MTSCFIVDPANDPAGICQATAAQWWEFLFVHVRPYQGLITLFVVATMVMALGGGAALLLVAWRQRDVARREYLASRPPVRFAPGRSSGRPSGQPRQHVYPVRCGEQTVSFARRRHGAGPAERVDPPP